MKKIILGMLFCLMLLFTSITAFASETMCILPDDFSENLGTFIIAKEDPKIGPFNGVNLKGKTDKNSTSTIPAYLGFEVPEDAEYMVYAHTRDFTSDQGQRNFRIGIDKTVFANKLGTHGVDGWAWENAGTVKLEKGEHVLKIVDNSAYYARFDMLVITSDKTLKFPETHAEMTEFSLKYKVKKAEVEIPKTLLPNQVFRNGFFYTSAMAEAINETGTWVLEKMKWVDNDTPLKFFFLNGLQKKDAVAENALITFAVPKDGEYYIWVRTKDFIEKQGTRTFNVSVDTTTLNTKFGCHGIDSWAWERSEAVKLTRGYHVLGFVDSSKSYARFDMFMITDDKEFVPDNRQIMSYKVLTKAKFDPVSVVPDIPCPVKLEEISQNATVYPARPSSEYAVSLNGKYIECKSDFSGKEALVSVEKIFVALGGKIIYKTENDICVSVNNNSYLFTKNDVFCLNGKKKIEMRAPAEFVGGEVYVPVRFLTKLEHVTALTEGKDVKVTYRIWR